MKTLETVLEQVGRVLSDRHGIRLVCQGNECATDGRTIYLPALPDEMPDDLWRTIRGYVDHESAHLLFNSNFKIAWEFQQKHGEDAFVLLNTFEDLRVERAMALRFPGSGTNLLHAYRSVEKTWQKKANAGEKVSLMAQLVFAVSAKAENRPAPAFVEPAALILAELIGDEATAAVNAPDTETVATLAESAWEAIKACLQPVPATPSTQAGDDSGKGDGTATQNSGIVASGVVVALSAPSASAHGDPQNNGDTASGNGGSTASKPDESPAPARDTAENKGSVSSKNQDATASESSGNTGAGNRDSDASGQGDATSAHDEPDDDASENSGSAGSQSDDDANPGDCDDDSDIPAVGEDNDASQNDVDAPTPEDASDVHGGGDESDDDATENDESAATGSEDDGDIEQDDTSDDDASENSGDNDSGDDDCDVSENGDSDASRPEYSTHDQSSGSGASQSADNSGSPVSSPAGASGSGVASGDNSQGQAAGSISAPSLNGVGVARGIIGGLGQELATAIDRYAKAKDMYRVWTKSNDTVGTAPNRSTVQHAERMAPLMRHVGGVRQKLLQTLMAETRSRWLPDAEDGALNPRALHRLAAAQYLRREGGGIHRNEIVSLTSRVFRRKVVAKRLKTAVTLLVDLSGSMDGAKLDIARNAALVLCEALARLNIPAAVWGFSTLHPGAYRYMASSATGISEDQLAKSYRFAPLIHSCYKQFDEPFRKIAGRFDSMRTHHYTPLGESLLFAARELSRRPEPRKVLLALTDGQPFVGLWDESVTFQHTKRTLVRIEQAGIDVALIGILENCVHDLHHRAVVVDNLEDLPRSVMAQLHALLTRDSRGNAADVRTAA